MKNIYKTLFILACLLCVGEVSYGQTNFYIKPANVNAPQTLGSWGANSDGTGTTPSNFTTGNQVFNVQSGQTVTAGAAWTVSGTGSKLLVQSGGIFRTGIFNHTLTLDMQANATYVNQNTNYSNLTFGVLDNNSTFEHANNTSSFATGRTYPNLTISSTQAQNPGAISTTINGNLTIKNGAEFRGTNTNNPTHTIGGSIIIESGGTWTTSNGAGTPTYNITGTITNNGAITALAANGTSTINLNGSNSQTVTWGTKTGHDHNINIASVKTVTFADNFVIAVGTLTTNGTLDCGTNTITGAGTFILASGATLRTGNTAGITSSGATGSIQTTTRTFNTGANYVYNGTAAQVTGTGLPATVNNLTINNTTSVKLTNSIAVSGTVTITAGDLDLDGKNINLGTTGVLAEDRANNHLLKDNTATSDYNKGGAIQFTADVDNATQEIRGTGLYLRSGSATPYNITVSRYHYNGSILSGGGYGIKRIYAISGTPSSSTMRIYYASDETTGVAGNLQIYRWTSSTGWKDGIASTAFDNPTIPTGSDGSGTYVQADAVTAFSHWTVGGESAPLPITLIGLKGRRVEGLNRELTEEVKLEWSTASEIKNKGFEVEMSENGIAYQKVAFVEGANNSNTPKNYQLTTINSNGAYYRLKQIDFDGTFSYSPIVFVAGVAGKLEVFPNPSAGKFVVRVGKKDEKIQLSLSNQNGKEMWRGVAQGGEAHINTTLPAGVYILRTVQEREVKMLKVIIR